jgi:DNA-binding protein H-NS
MDISAISSADLRDLLHRIPTELKRREKEEKAALRKKLEELASASGYSVTDLFGLDGEKVERAPVPAKYRSKTDPNLTWSGRGRQPQWVMLHIADGGTWEEITI